MKLAASVALAVLAAVAQATKSSSQQIITTTVTDWIPVWTTSPVLVPSTMTESGEGDVKTHTLEVSSFISVLITSPFPHEATITEVPSDDRPTGGISGNGHTWSTGCTSNKLSDCPTQTTEGHKFTSTMLPVPVNISSTGTKPSASVHVTTCAPKTSDTQTSFCHILPSTSSQIHDHNTPPRLDRRSAAETETTAWITCTMLTEPAAEPSVTTFRADEFDGECSTTLPTSSHTATPYNTKSAPESIVTTIDIWPTPSTKSQRQDSTKSVDPDWTSLLWPGTTTWTLPVPIETTPSQLSTISSALNPEPTTATPLDLSSTDTYPSSTQTHPISQHHNSTAAGVPTMPPDQPSTTAKRSTSRNMTRTHPTSLHYNSWTAGEGATLTPPSQPLPITINGTVTSMTWFPETGKPKPTSIHSGHHMSSHNSSIIKTQPPKPTTTPDMWSSVHFPPPGRANSTLPHITIPLTIITTLDWSPESTSDPVDTLHPAPPFGTQISADPPTTTSCSSLDPVGHLTVTTVTGKSRGSTDDTPNMSTPTGHIPTPITGPTEGMGSLTRHASLPTQASTLLTVVRRV